MITLILGGFDRRRETTSHLECYSLHRASSFCLFLIILARAMCKVPLAEAET